MEIHSNSPKLYYGFKWTILWKNHLECQKYVTGKSLGAVAPFPPPPPHIIPIRYGYASWIGGNGKVKQVKEIAMKTQHIAVNVVLSGWKAHGSHRLSEDLAGRKWEAEPRILIDYQIKHRPYSKHVFVIWSMNVSQLLFAEEKNIYMLLFHLKEHRLIRRLKANCNSKLSTVFPFIIITF